MENEAVCFPAPLNACFPLSSGGGASDVEAEEDDLQALKELASGDCYLCKLDELVGEDWD